MQERYSGQVIWEMLVAVQDNQHSDHKAARAFAELVSHMYPTARQALAQWRARQHQDALQEDLVAVFVAHTQRHDAASWSAWFHWLLWQGQRRFRASLNDPESMADWLPQQDAKLALALGRAIAHAFDGCEVTPLHADLPHWCTTLDRANDWCKDTIPKVCQGLGWKVQVVEGHAISDSAPFFTQKTTP